MLKFFCVGILGLAGLSVAVAAVPTQTKPAASTRKLVKKVLAPKPVPLPPVVLEELSPARLRVSEKVVLGDVPCELGAHVVVKQDSNPGRFLLEHGRLTYRMEPMLTSTGAIRLEDPTTGVVWLQLGNKSMLLNQRMGKRLADACVNLSQAAIATAMEQTKAPGLLDDEAPTPPQLPASH